MHNITMKVSKEDDNENVLDRLHASKALASAFALQPYNVRPVETNPPVKGMARLFVGEYPVECPFQTVHGLYSGGDAPKGFAKQPCVNACPHASLLWDGKSKNGVWRMTCSGVPAEIGVELRENNIIVEVKAGMAAV